MKILKIYFDHLRMFEGGILNLDLYASDRVPALDESTSGLSRSLHVNNLIALAGINATGKTTVLNLLELACRMIGGLPMSGGMLPASLPMLFDAAPKFRCLVWHDGNAYLVESQIVLGDMRYPMFFSDERVSILPDRQLRRRDLSSWV